jgi:hypothetical protein
MTTKPAGGVERGGLAIYRTLPSSQISLVIGICGGRAVTCNMTGERMRTT